MTAWRESFERSARAGRLRVAPHFYNAEEEIDRMISTVAGLAGLAGS